MWIAMAFVFGMVTGFCLLALILWVDAKRPNMSERR
jgi:hypothetical protein